MSKKTAKTILSAAVDAAIAKGAETIVEIDATMARFIKEVRELAANPGVFWGCELVAEMDDNDLAKMITGALTTKTAIKKVKRALYRQIDPYGRVAEIKARNAAAA